MKIQILNTLLEEMNASSASSAHNYAKQFAEKRRQMNPRAAYY